LRKFRLLRFIPKPQTTVATGPRANVNTELKHWLEELLRACDSLDLNLARYVTSSGKTVELGALPQAQKHDLFPCPPPFPGIVTKCTKLDVPAEKQTVSGSEGCVSCGLTL
jgi:hypothetical protein